jgi:hypothetical protein
VAHGVKPPIKQLGCAWALESSTQRPPQEADKGLSGKYRMGKIANVWPPDLRAYAIDSMRELGPEALAENLVEMRNAPEKRYPRNKSIHLRHSPDPSDPGRAGNRRIHVKRQEI